MTARRAVLSLQTLPSEGVVAMVESLEGGEVSFVQVISDLLPSLSPSPALAFFPYPACFPPAARLLQALLQFRQEVEFEYIRKMLA